MADIAAIILAAGRGSRFDASEGDSKVLAEIRGIPMLRRVAETALASRADPVIVVTGHASEAVARVLAGLDVRVVANPDWRDGMASSLRAGVAATPSGVSGALIVLADMPLVTSATLDVLVDTFETRVSVDAVIPVHEGRKGNPVLLGRSLFDAISGLSGDEGARTLLKRPDCDVVLCPVDDAGVAVDIDTREAPTALVSHRFE